MKTIFIRVENMRLKFELLNVDNNNLPVLYRYFNPQRFYARPPSELTGSENPIRFVGHNFIFCRRTHRIYIWDLLRLDHADVQRGLEEFLKIHFHPTPNHEETKR